MGIKKDIKFASIDNPDEYKLSSLPITCVEQPIEGLAERALEVLFRKISDPKYSVIENITLQANIVRHIKQSK